MQLQIQISGYNDELTIQERQAQSMLDSALKIEEIFWQEKSRVKWHDEGDRKTRYFHRMAKIKNATKLISTIINGDQVISNQEEIASHIIHHYADLFNNSSILQHDGLT